MSNENKHLEVKAHLLGWILFTVCAIFFIISSVRGEDNMALVASVIFLVACLVFMAPLLVEMKSRR